MFGLRFQKNFRTVAFRWLANLRLLSCVGKGRYPRLTNHSILLRNNSFLLLQVYDDVALADAKALFHFLQRRSYIAQSPEFPLPPLPCLLREATPLTGVEMVEAPVCGVVAWRVRPGDHVNTGDVLGEIVNVADLSASRRSLVSRTCGIVFGMRGHKLVSPGEIVVKVFNAAASTVIILS